jgi:hypothetical protein
MVLTTNRALRNICLLFTFLFWEYGSFHLPEDRPVARPLSTHDKINTSIPRVGNILTVQFFQQTARITLRGHSPYLRRLLALLQVNSESQILAGPHSSGWLPICPRGANSSVPNEWIFPEIIFWRFLTTF